MPESIRGAQIVLEDVWNNKNALQQESKKSLRAKISALEAEKKAFLDRAVKTNDATLQGEYENIASSKLQEIELLQKELAKNKYSQEDFKVAMGVVLNFLSDPVAQWEKPNFRNKRLLLDMYFEDKLTYNPETGFQTPRLPNVLKAIQENSNSKIKLVERVELTGKH